VVQGLANFTLPAMSNLLYVALVWRWRSSPGERPHHEGALRLHPNIARSPMAESLLGEMRVSRGRHEARICRDGVGRESTPDDPGHRLGRRVAVMDEAHER